MRVAFYAPMKPPDDPVPSGDRRMARSLLTALRKAGHKADVASKFRSRDSAGDPLKQRRIVKTGERWAERLVDRFRREAIGARPDIWFTYHLYYKAPDIIGPVVADRLEIPYVVAEASSAPKRADGPWSLFHKRTEFAIGRADAIIPLNPVDMGCVEPLMKPEAMTVPLKPFIDLGPYAGVRRERRQHRAHLAAGLGVDPDQPWLVAAGMMRQGAKTASYRALAQALVPLAAKPWQLLIAGDGPARAVVEADFARFGEDRIFFLGQVEETALPGVFAASDLMVWPAVDEAFCMVLLESQAAGTPVVAGRYGGVPEMLAAGTTGLLSEPGDIPGFTAAIEYFLTNPDQRASASDSCRTYVQAYHGMAGAARTLDTTLKRLRKAKG